MGNKIKLSIQFIEEPYLFRRDLDWTIKEVIPKEKQQFTPRPWTRKSGCGVVNRTVNRTFGKYARKHIAMVNRYEHPDHPECSVSLNECKANTALIKQAPEMFGVLNVSTDVLEMFLTLLPPNDPARSTIQYLVEKSKKILRKAVTL